MVDQCPCLIYFNDYYSSVTHVFTYLVMNSANVIEWFNFFRDACLIECISNRKMVFKKLKSIFGC